MTGVGGGPREEGRLLTDVHHRGPAMSDSVTYSAVLPVSEETVLFVSALLATERRRRRTRSRRRALGCYRQAVLVLRWFLNGTRLAQLASDNAISASDGLPVSARGHRCPRRGRAGAARRAAGRPRRRAHPRARRWHADPHRSLLRAGPDRAHRPSRPAGGSVVVGQARRARRQHPGGDRSRRLADLDVGRAAARRLIRAACFELPAV